MFEYMLTAKFWMMMYILFDWFWIIVGDCIK